MTQLTIQLPETAFSALQKDPEEFAWEMRLAAAVKWYELGQISQERAAEIAGLSRAEFINALSRFQVSPFQYTEAELREELKDAHPGQAPGIDHVSGPMLSIVFVNRACGYPMT